MAKDENCCKTHGIVLGIGIIIFGVVLYFTSSLTALENNLNWSAAFFALGVMCIIKALFFPCCCKK